MATTERSAGIGFCGLLCLLFIGLKLTGYITWSWFWVLFPVTFPLMIIGIILAVIIIAAALDR